MYDTLDESMDYWGGDEEEEEEEEFGGDEFSLESFWGGDEESAQSRKRNQRKKAMQRRALARRKAALKGRRRRGAARPPARRNAAAALRQTQQEVQTVGLENKVQGDVMAAELAKMRKQLNGTQYAVALGAPVFTIQQELENFREDLGEEATDLAIGLTPYLASGVLATAGQNYKAPAVAAAVGGGAFLLSRLFNQLRSDDNGNEEPKRLTVTHYLGTIPVGTSSRYRANVDGVTWSSDNETVATVNADGVVTGVAVGSTTIKATKDQDYDLVPVTVVDPSDGM